MTQLVEIPFDAGQDESTAKELLPRGILRTAQDVRLARNGRLEPRPAMADISQGGTGGTIYADGLFAYRDRPLVLGSSGSAAEVPFEAYHQVTDATTWYGLTDEANGNLQVPGVTDVRDLPELAPGEKARGVSIAAGMGYVCAAWTNSAGDGFVKIVRASDGALLSFSPLADIGTDVLYHLRVVFQNSTFLVFGVNADETELSTISYRPGTDSAWQSAAVSIGGTSANTVRNLEVAAVQGGTAVVMVIHRTGPSLTLRSRTVSGGTLSGGINVTGIDAVNNYDRFAIDAAGSPVSRIVFAGRLSATGEVSVWTYDTSGTLVTGPTTAAFNCVAATHTHADDTLSLGLTLSTEGATNFRLFECARVSGASSRILMREYAIDTHTVSIATLDFRDALMSAGPLTRYFGLRFVSLVGAYHTGPSTTGDGVRLEPFSMFQLRANTVTPGVHRACSLDHDTGAGTQLFPAASLCVWPIVCQDASTGLYYVARLAPNIALEDTGGAHFSMRVSEFRWYDTDQRASAELGGELLVAGGLPLTYANGMALTAIGIEPPRIYSATPSNGAGSLDVSATYTYYAVFSFTDARGNVIRSRPSEPVTMTTGGSDDTGTLIVSAPKTDRLDARHGRTYLEVYRNQFTGGAGGVTFHSIAAPTACTTDRLTITDTISDTALILRPILYTQSQTPVEHSTPGPFRFIAAGRSRAVIGGLQNETEVRFSKRLFPAEPVTFAPAGSLAFSKFLNEPVTAVMALDEQYIAATRRALYRIVGDGPDDSGSGEFSDPERIPGLGGVTDWRSVVETPEGYFFQTDVDKLAFIDRGGSVSWDAGQAVRDTLEAFPVITSARYARRQNCVFFACDNAAGNAGRTLVYDLRRKVWYVDTERFKTLVEIDGALTGLRTTGIVSQESASALASTATVTTGAIRNGTLLSWQQIHRVGVRATALAAFPSITLSIDYLDGSGPQSLGAHTVGALSVDAPITRLWTIPQTKCQVFALTVAFTDAALHALVFEIEPRAGRTRRGSGDLK